MLDYDMLMNTDFNREWPADVINSVAVKKLESGLVQEAELLFSSAFDVEPDHPLIVYNRGLHMWRNSSISAEDIITNLKAIEANYPMRSLLPYLRGLLHLEFGDAESALKELNEAEGKLESDPDQFYATDIREALLVATSEIKKNSKVVREYPCYGRTPIALTLTKKLTPVVIESKSWNTANIINLFDGGTINSFSDFENSPRTGAVFSDLSYAIIGGEDNKFSVYDIKTGNCMGSSVKLGGTIDSILISQNNQYLVVVNKINEIHFDGIAPSWEHDTMISFWDLKEGRKINSFEMSGSLPVAVAINRNGNIGLIASDELCLYDLASSTKIMTLNGHDAEAIAVAIASAKDIAISGDATGVICVWELNTGECLSKLEGHSNSIRTVSISDDGKTGLSGDEGGSIRLWDLESGKCLRHFIAHTGSVTFLALSNDGGLALSASTGYYIPARNPDNKIKLWDFTRNSYQAPYVLTDPQLVQQTLGCMEQYQSLLFATDTLLNYGKVMEASSELNEIYKMQGYSKSYKVVQLNRRINGSAAARDVRAVWISKTIKNFGGSELAATTDGKLIFSAYGSKIYCIEAESCKPSYKLEGHEAGILSVAVSQDGQWGVSAGCRDGTVRCWNLKSGLCEWVYNCKDENGYLTEPVSVVTTPDNRYCVAADCNKIWVIDINTGKCIREIIISIENKGTITRLMSPAILEVTTDGVSILSGTYGQIKVWDLSSGKCKQNYGESHCWKPWKSNKASEDRNIKSLLTSPSGKYVFSAESLNDSNVVKVWEVKSVREVNSFKLESSINALAISNDESFLLIGCTDNKIHIFSVVDKHRLLSVEGHTDAVTSICWLNQNQFVSGGRDGIIRIWEVDWKYQ